MLNNIEVERVRKRISKKELARELNISVKTYYNWIYEQTDVPSSALLKMSALFGVDINYLLKDCEGVKPGNEAV